jgi:acyl-CoA synthetase (AMP-forming)/AMP-acid ligase II
MTSIRPYAGKTASAGRAAPSVDVKSVDREDHEVPSGTVGEIITRGPQVMHGYWNKPEETAQALLGG